MKKTEPVLHTIPGIGQDECTAQWKKVSKKETMIPTGPQPTRKGRRKSIWKAAVSPARAESLRFWKNGKPLEPQTLYIWESVKRMKGLVDLFLSVSNQNPCHGTWGYEVTNKFWGTEGSTVGRRRKMEPLSLSLAKWTGLWPCLPNNFSTYGARRFHISRSEWDRVFSRLAHLSTSASASTPSHFP